MILMQQEFRYVMAGCTRSREVPLVLCWGLSSRISLALSVDLLRAIDLVPSETIMGRACMKYFRNWIQRREMVFLPSWLRKSSLKRLQYKFLEVFVGIAWFQVEVVH